MMKTYKLHKRNKILIAALLLFAVVGCERDLSDDAVPATFSTLGDIFTDDFIGMGANFYFPFADSKQDAFSVDNTEGFESDASYRVDVPNANNPNGTYAGAILRIDGAGRDLTGYDALTFYAKASQGVVLDEVGFGVDFIDDTYRVAASGLSVGTNWTKYTVPIPDASFLTQERGVFWYSDGTQETGGSGYTIWFDEIKFENLGTVAQPRPQILNGEDQFQQTFIGSQSTIGGLTQTFNLANGQDQTVGTAPSYFEFMVSGPSIVNVDEFGTITVTGSSPIDTETGEFIPTVITANLDGIMAEGSLSLVSLGDFTQAPIPDEAPENVISLFSDAYNDVPVDYYNGFFNADGQTTQGGAPPINIGGGEVINYTNLNFVGVGTFLNVSPIDATEMTHLHVDINVQETLDPGDFIRLQILNGVQTANETSGSVTIPVADLVSDGWGSYDIPLGQFTGLGGRDQLGLLFFISDSTVSNIYVDNIYYYKEVVEPSDNVIDTGATQSELPIGFESGFAYSFVGFEGADTAIEANPDQSGINPTNTVMRTTKTVGAQFFAGTALELDVPVDFSTSQLFRMKVWSPKAGIPVKVRFENAGNTVGMEVDANTTTTNEWHELEWDFSGQNFNGASYVRIVVFFEFINGVPGDGSTYYFDDLKILEP